MLRTSVSQTNAWFPARAKTNEQIFTIAGSYSNEKRGLVTFSKCIVELITPRALQYDKLHTSPVTRPIVFW